jgi:hypothetical protein
MIDMTYASYGCGGNCTINNIILVGTKPKGNGRWGHADLGGNLQEWTFDGHTNLYPNRLQRRQLRPRRVGERDLAPQQVLAAGPERDDRFSLRQGAVTVCDAAHRARAAEKTRKRLYSCGG